MRDRLRRFRLHLVAVALLGAVVIYAVTSSAAPVVPLPSPIVWVHTESGGVVRDTPVPIGGVPVPIDVDNGSLLGVLSPDIDVSVGLVSVPELPANILVPNIVVKRDALAVLRNAPAPPLKLNARVVIDDIGNLKRLATVDYGFETPPGARIPPIVTAKLIGPPTSGFIDPLIAKIESPGYSGPLKFNLKATTETFEGTFALKFDPLPEFIKVNMDPRDDGLDFTYDHSGPSPDVKLDATADLKDVPTGRVRHIGASVERLPNHIQLSNTNTHDKTFIEYFAGSDLGKPDLEADYRDTLGNGTIVTDANVKVSGLPSHMQGTVNTRPGANGTTDIDAVKFAVLDGGEIDAVDFIARNFIGNPATVPEYNLGPDQFVSVVTRRQPDGTSRFRAAGRLEAIRGGEFKRVGPNHDKLDITTSVGDGTKPLRAILDSDTRGAPAADDPKFMKVDATVTPLPANIHVFFEPTVGTDPMHLVYDASNAVDIDADATIATGPTEGCGQDRVICALARVDKVPTHMDIKLPAKGGTDFSISHNGGASQRPDVRATIDVGPDTTATPKPTTRTWIKAGLLRIPNEVRGRLDSAGGALRKAEFHGCSFDYNSNPPACTDTQGAIGRVTFTVRDQPSRAGLPPRPDVASQYVTLIGRKAGRFEVQGRVDEVRNVVFHQLDLVPGDAKTDGVLGALVDVGVGGDAFDLVVDDLGDALDETVDPPVVIGDKKSDIAVNVGALPRVFTACVRSTKEEAPPSYPNDDPLLAPCETSPVSPDAGEHAVVPLTAVYTAKDALGNPAPTKVTANVKATAPSVDDLDASLMPIENTSKLDLTIDKVPGSLRADVIPPITPDPANSIAGRKLKLVYDANAKIDAIDFALENRRASSICEDPRPARKALCVSGKLVNLPKKVTTTYDPDESKGDIDFKTEPANASPKLSIAPFHLSKVSPGAKDQPLVVDATVNGITPHMTGKFVSLHTPSDPPDEKSLGRMTFDACPPDVSSCEGIDSIDFKATNALVGDPLPNAPLPDADTTQDFSFVQRGLDFRALGHISKLKEIGLSKLKADGTPSPTTKVRAAFGDGTSAEKLRAFIDRVTVTDPDTNSGLESQRVHAVISDAPKAINLCYRDTLEPPNLPEPETNPSADFCDKAPAEKLAVQSRLDEAAGGAKPDIDIRELHLAKGGGTDFLDGTIFIKNLAQRIDVLAGKGDKTDIVVEGHDIDDGPTDSVKNVADRVRFDLRNYEGNDNGTGEFPFVSLNGAQDPQDDTRVDEGTEENYAKVVKDVDTLLLKGSIPDIKRIALQPGACENDPVRFPPAGTYPSADVRPEYTCVNLIAAQNHPLGLAIRTKDDKGEILSMDEGFIDSVPGGADGILATLGKSPAKAKLNPICGEPGGTAANGCRPPLLSVKALKASGQSTNLQARLAIGPEKLVNDLKAVNPLDEYSKRLDYEMPVDKYDDDGVAATPDSKGVRLKLGTGKTGDAVRVGFNLDLPDYLDIDQPLSYSCKRQEVASNTVLSPDDSACKQTDVKPETNNGFESKDIHARIVGSNTGHLGTDIASLGRAAILIHSTDDNKQQVLTGPFPATGSHGTIGDDPLGSPPETAPPVGQHDLGIDLPGYLDARVFIRGKYEAPGDEDVQTTYYQIDGRVNSPLSLALRDVQSAALDGTNQTGRTRSGKDVAAMQVALRNAPGLGGNAPDFSKPTFRLRAEMRKKHKEPDVGPYECNGFNPGGGRTAGFGANFCIYTPGDHIEKWMDVGLNMKPDSDAASRTVDVVLDSTDYTQIDMHAFDSVDGTSLVDGIHKGAEAGFTPQAGLRLQPFPIGLEVGLGIGIVGGNTLLLLDGDLILKLTGRDVDRLRLSQNKGKMRVLAENGPNPASTVKTHDQTVAVVQVRAEALFGLISENVVDVRTDPYHQPVEFKRCQFPGLGFIPSGFDYFDVAPDDSTSTAIALTPGFIPAGGDAAEVLTGVSELLAPIWCLFGTEDNQLVNDSHPAPAFTEPGRVINGGGESTPPATTPQNTTPPAPGNLTVGDGDGIPEVSDTVKLCGSPGFKDVTVKSDGILDVGNEGDSITDSVDADGPGGEPPNVIVTPCDGGLILTADNFTVDAGGVVDANATRVVTAGPGAGGTGGGAGHSGAGGQSGGNPGTGGATYGVGAGGVPADFGSRGGTGAGGAVGGAGGGTLDLQVTNKISVSGTIRANGAAGAGNGADCTVDGGGGGSGGHVRLTSNQVVVGGSVQARGGGGGNGGDAGGGGGGGRITVNTVDPRPAAASLNVNAGTAGSPGGGAGCDAGSNGGTGNNTLGTTLNQAAGVSFDTTADVPPTYVENSVPLKIRAVRNGGGRMHVIVCKRSIGPSDPDTLNDTGLDPPSGGLSAIIDPSFCTSENFNDADTPGGSIYTRSITRSVSDGFHGFYAVAAEAPGINPGSSCLDPGSIFLGHDGCTYQETVPGGTDVLPTKSQVKVASDDTGPNVAFSNPNGDPGCAGGRRCLSEAGTMSVTAGDTVGGVGLATVLCSVNGGPFDKPCGPGDTVSVDVGTVDGIADVEIRAEDRLGNRTTIPGPQWVVDRSGGDTPTITKTETDPTETNGWRQSKPTISVHAEDNLTGYVGTPITFFTDTSSHHCGTISNKTISIGPFSFSLPLVADCSTTDTDPFVPAEGIHSFQAQATDRLGNKSLKSDIVSMKVDGTPPTTSIFLGPKHPDGGPASEPVIDNRWYRTRPFVAFRAVDNVGGSGVNIDHVSGVSKIEFKIDGGSFQTWDPDDPNELTDGIHSVCYRGTDLAGNTSATSCRNDIKVDSTAPAASDPIAPASPDGNNSFYVTTPTVAPSAGDPLPAGVNFRSGVAKTEYQIDDGAWTTAVPFNVPEGEHEIRVRAFDVAGNPSEIRERVVRVDLSNPSAKVVSYPPNPNGQNWFRQNRIDSVSAKDQRDGSGVDGATYQIDANGSISYLRPFAVEQGVHTTKVIPRDRAGRNGPTVTQPSNVDVTRPVGTPSPQQASSILISLLGIFGSTTLKYTVTDDLAPRVKVSVFVYDELGNLVRRLPVTGPYPGGFSSVGPGQVVWNGRKEDNRGALPGLYHFRVQAIDQAGNSVLSTESKNFLVVQGILPL